MQETKLAESTPPLKQNAREKYVKKKFKNYVIESYCKNSTINMFLENGFYVDSKLYLVKKKKQSIKANLKAV